MERIRSDNSMKKLKCIILAIGIVFLVIGIASGEVNTVFQKASMICMECIGIG